MPEFADPATPATPIHVIPPDTAEDWVAAQPDHARAQLAAKPFKGALADIRTLIAPDGAVDCVLAGWGSAQDRARHQFPLGGLAARVPPGCYRLESMPSDADPALFAFAWLRSGYRFDRYKTRNAQAASLVAPAGVDPDRILAEVRAADLTADLINTPANDMGPHALIAAMADLAQAHGAKMTEIAGDALLEQNFPLIHAVGRAGGAPPRLGDFQWGDPAHPKVTLVGKGVCFDTGGLNLKPGGSMGLMKKDMGGAATVLGLAQMIMVWKLPIRLRVLVPAVENGVSAGAFRPGDILTARNGRTVEINNTDAEGRLILADALALAAEETPQILVSMATLTGAARVALGPDLVPYFTDDDGLSHALHSAGRAVADPVWQLPFWDPYEDMIEPDIADLDNAPKGGFAGAITAALFLRRFTAGADAYMHFDCYGWTPSAKPGRPTGGTAQGARAMFRLLSDRFAA
ncbi:MAG: leucyl aminopeptidase family protein [Pseudomonadota bacterium]